MSRIVCVSFANTNTVYHRNQQLLHESILENTNISHHYAFTEKTIPSDFFNRFSDRFKSDPKTKRGYYCWAWKPYLLNHVMNMESDDTIILYFDSSSLVRKLPNDFLNRIIHKGICVFDNYHTNEIYVKGDCRKLFQNDNEWRLFLKSMQLDASLMGMMNNAFNRSWMKQWMNLCCDEELISDTVYTHFKNPEGFRDHRHDQSLLSYVIWKTFDDNIRVSKKHKISNAFYNHRRRDASNTIEIPYARDYDKECRENRLVDRKKIYSIYGVIWVIIFCIFYKYFMITSFVFVLTSVPYIVMCEQAKIVIK